MITDEMGSNSSKSRTPKALISAKIMIRDELCVYRVSKLKFAFTVMSLLNALFLIFILFPLLALPKNIIVEIYRAVIAHLAKFGIPSLHALVFKASPLLSAIFFLYIFFSSDRIRLTSKEMFLAIHPVSLADILVSRVIFRSFFYSILFSAYLIVFYAGTYISGYLLSPILAYVILLMTVLSFEMLIEFGNLLNSCSSLFRFIWLVLATLSVYDCFKGTLTISYLIYLPVVSILNCYTNMNVLPAFIEFFAIFAVFYAVSNIANPDLEEISASRKVSASREAKRVARITPLTKSLIELERSFLVYMVVASLISLIAVLLFGGEIAARLAPYWARMILFYSLFFAIMFVEGFAAMEASSLWFYRVSCSERSYVISSMTGGVILTAGTILPVAILVYPVIGISSFCMLAAAMLIPPYFTLVTTYLCSKTKMKVTRMLNAKKELGDVRALSFLFELPIMFLYSFAIIFLPVLSAVFVVSPILLLPLIERVARGVEVQ